MMTLSNLPSVIEDGVDAMEEVLDDAFAVLRRFRPFHRLTGAAGLFEYHPAGP